MNPEQALQVLIQVANRESTGINGMNEARIISSAIEVLQKVLAERPSTK